MPLPIVVLAVVFVVLCAVVDVRERRIPNLLSGTAMLGGTLLNLSYGGASGAVASLVGVVLGGGLLLAPFALGGVGAGDVKMMGAVGALLGPQIALLAGLLGMVLGGVLMAAHLTRLGRLAEINRRLVTMVRSAVAGRSTAPLQVNADAPGTVALPYSVPLGLGTLLAMAVSA